MSAPDGFLEAALGEDYPLMPGAPAALAPVLADMVLSLDPLQLIGVSATDSAAVTQVTASSGQLHFIIGLGSGTILDTDDNNVSVARQTVWGTWTLFEWMNSLGVVLRVIVDTAGFTALGSYDSGTISAAICPRAIHIRPARVSTIVCPAAYTINAVTGLPASQETSPAAVSGNVTIEAGYNTVISLSGSTLQVDFAAGAGNGRYPLCTQQPNYVRSINGVTVGDDGSLILQATDCYWLERRIGTPDPHAQTGNFTVDATHDTGTYGFYNVSPAGKLQLHNDCPPCSDCSTYAALYKLLRVVYTRLKAVQGRTLSAIGQYDSIRQSLLAFSNQGAGGAGTNANFTLNGNSARLTMGFAFVAGGTNTFDQVSWIAEGPICPTIYLAGSGLQITKSKAASFSPQSAGNHYTYTDNETIGPGVAGAWTFDIQVLCPAAQNGATLTFGGTITAREVLADGTTVSHSYGPFSRTMTFQESGGG